MQKYVRNPILLFLFTAAAFTIAGCGDRSFVPMSEFSGYAQGTTFHILCDSTAQITDEEIESVFKDIDRSMSLWDSLSLISRFNRSKTGLFVDAHFVEVFNLSKRIHQETEGAFNPALYPIIKYWGFGQDRFHEDSLVKKSTPVDSLLKYCRFEDIQLGEEKRDSAGKEFRFIRKKYPQNALDFNGIAQGYTVDVLCAFLDKKGIANYMVEVGGEVRAKGLNRQKKAWQIGIDKPTDVEETRQIHAIVSLENRALATSGNYRKYYEKDGKKLSHSIDPTNGKPAENMLLSASVFAPSAAEADGYATAFMVMGATKATEFLNRNPQIMAYLISSGFNTDYQTWMSPQLEKLIQESK